MNLCCVKCNSVLDRSRVADIDVDLCPACGGLWLDRGELERLGAVPDGQVQALRNALTGGAHAGISDTMTACPACPGTLAEVKLGRVQVDFCRRCGGMFLDRGELDAALAAVKGTTVAQVLALARAVAR